MLRASPWISYDPFQRYSLPTQTTTTTTPVKPTSSQEHHTTQEDMDAPEISTLREEEEETPPPPEPGLSFSKFRINMRGSSWSQVVAASGSAVGPPLGPQPAGRRGLSPPDSDDEDEEDQLIDDDELAIVTETGRGPATSSPGRMVTPGSPTPSGSPRKRGGSLRGPRQRRGAVTGRRGRPGREPPDAAAMMSTFEVTKGDQLPVAPPQLIHSAINVPNPNPPPQLSGLSTTDWSTSTPPKPPRKKPGPKKGTNLGPRGPRKNPSKTAQYTPGSSTPLDETFTDPSTFLVPAAPSIPPTPGPDQVPPTSHLPPIPPPDFTLDPGIPVPVYPLPSRAFPVQAPPKVPTGYAPTHPIDPKRGPARKWAIMQREIKSIGGGRWLARTWVAPQTVPPPIFKAFSPPPPPDVGNASVSQLPPEVGPSRVSALVSRASSVKAEAGAAQALLELDQVDAVRWPMAVHDHPEGGIPSRGPASPRSRTNSSPPPSPGATEEIRARPS